MTKFRSRTKIVERTVFEQLLLKLTARNIFQSFREKNATEIGISSVSHLQTRHDRARVSHGRFVVRFNPNENMHHVTGSVKLVQYSEAFRVKQPFGVGTVVLVYPDEVAVLAG